MVVVQMTLLFGSKTWVMTPQLEKALEGFHHLAARRIVGMEPKRQNYGTWMYPPTGVAMEMVELEEIWVYIDRLHNTVA